MMQKQKIISEIEKWESVTELPITDSVMRFFSSKDIGRTVPVYYKEGMPYTLPVSALPLELPEVEKYYQWRRWSAIRNAKNFAWDEVNQKVVSVDLIDEKTIFSDGTFYNARLGRKFLVFLRYMDPKNDEFCAKDLSDYWDR